MKSVQAARYPFVTYRDRADTKNERKQMQMKKKILALLLALVMILPLVVACQNTPDEPDNTDDSTASEANTDESGTPDDSEEETKEEVAKDYLADYKEKTNGKTVTILQWQEYTMQEFDVDPNKDMSDNINNAIFKRNEAVKDRLGVTLKFIETTGNSKNMANYIDKVKSDFGSSQTEYDMFAAYSRIAPQLAYKGYVEDLNSLEPLDLSAAWWPASLIDECKVGDKVYFCSGDLSTNMLWMMTGVYFNKSLLDQYKLDYPYELVKENKWTMETLKTMSANVFNELDSKEGKTDGDFYGLTIYDDCLDALSIAGGFTSISRDASGKLVLDSNFFGEKMQNYMKFLYEWFHTSDGYFYSKSTTGARNMFKESRALFMVDRLFVAAGKDSNTDEANKEGISFGFGIVPVPMYEESQGGYGTGVGHNFTTYAISKKANDKTATAATLELLGAESYRYVTPAVFEVAMKLRYSKDDVDSEMYDLIRNSVKFELGRLMQDCISKKTSTLFKETILADSFSTKSYKSSVGTINTALTEFNKTFGLE